MSNDHATPSIPASSATTGGAAADEDGTSTSLIEGVDELDRARFKAGEQLFQENENSYHFFIIQSGEVEVYKTDDENANKEIHLAKVGPGNSLGEFAMLDRKPRSASARALTDVVAVRVSAEGYEHLLGELPDWAVSVMRALVERLRNTNEVVRQLKRSSHLDQQDRIALESAEFADTNTKVTGVTVPTDSDEPREGTFTEFDFSVFESSSAPKPQKR